MNNENENDDAESSSRLADAVASTSLALFERIAPPGGSLAHNGAMEWTCLACICLVIEGEETPQIVPISLATGTKTLPYCDVKKGQGDIVHDSHAEVLARRGARQWLAERMLVEKGARGDEVVEGLPLVFNTTENHKWELKDKVRIWWYISTLPCGQCSMPYAMRKRAREDEMAGGARSHVTLGPASPSSAVTRGRHDALNAAEARDTSRPNLRTVPGRADSPPSLSHSCSDKLLLWNTIGWQGSILSRYIERVPIDAIVVSKPDPNEPAPRLTHEMQRGLDIALHMSGTESLLKLADELQVPQTKLVPPTVHIASAIFSQSQYAVQQKALKAGIPEDELREKVSPAWGATNWIRPSATISTLVQSQSTVSNGQSNKSHHTAATKKETESLVNGIRRGAPFKRGRIAGGANTTLPLSDKARSRLCKLEWFHLMRVFESIISPHSMAIDEEGITTYAQHKGKCDVVETLVTYRTRKNILRGGGQVSAAKQHEIVDAWLDSLPFSQKKRKQSHFAKGDDAAVQRKRSQFAQDDDAAVQTAETPTTTATSADALPQHPLQGWLITPSSLESFNIQGVRSSDSDIL